VEEAAECYSKLATAIHPLKEVAEEDQPELLWRVQRVEVAVAVTFLVHCSYFDL
jgi:hypothetical protein